jgi:hypothetical protein
MVKEELLVCEGGNPRSSFGEYRATLEGKKDEE